MAWTLRCRHPGGQATLSGVSPDMTVGDFLALLEAKTGVPVGSQQVLVGFPPKPLQLSEVQGVAPLSSLPVSNGESLTVNRVAPAAPPATTPAAPSPPQDNNNHNASGSILAQEDDEDAQLARAIAASLEPASSNAVAAAPEPSHPSRPDSSVTRPAAPAERVGAVGREMMGYSHPVAGEAAVAAAGGGQGKVIPAAVSMGMADGSCVVRRVVPSDNSCLFASVGYVMQRSRARGPELREVIAQAVADDPELYNDGFLGQSNADYCRWIRDPKHWGGAIELSILCRHFGREIAAYDIQTCRCDVYGQDQGYGERVMLLYDGLHYDALAVSAGEGAPEEWDVTVYEPSPAGTEEQRRAAEIERAAKALVDSCHKARQFTDTANFTLRCGICQIGLKGEKEAVQHAKDTGHQNFSEY